MSPNAVISSYKFKFIVRIRRFRTMYRAILLSFPRHGSFIIWIACILQARPVTVIVLRDTINSYCRMFAYTNSYCRMFAYTNSYCRMFTYTNSYCRMFAYTVTATVECSPTL
jgi:hypothetical protein